MNKKVAGGWFRDENNRVVITGWLPPDINPDNLPWYKVQVDPRPPLHPDDATTKRDWENMEDGTPDFRQNKKIRSEAQIYLDCDEDGVTKRDREKMEEGSSNFRRHKRNMSMTGPPFDPIKEKNMENMYITPPPDTLSYVNEINKTTTPPCTTQPTENEGYVCGHRNPETIKPSPAVHRSDPYTPLSHKGCTKRTFPYTTVYGSEGPVLRRIDSDEGFEEPIMFHVFHDEKPKRG